MPKFIRNLTNNIVYSASFQVNKTPNPGFAPGYIGSTGQVGVPTVCTITVTGSQFLDLYDDSDNYIGTYTIADLPNGFILTAIDQFGGIPCANSGGGSFMMIPASAGGGATIDSWDAGILPLSNVDSTFVPATMSYQWLNGFWVFNAQITIPAGVTPAVAAAIVSMFKSSMATYYPTVRTSSYDDNVPLMLYRATWDIDEGSCPVIGALTNVQIVDPVTGEFSWSYPSGITTVVIKITQPLHDDIIATVSSPTTNYVPSGIYGDATVTITPISTFPICYGPVSTLSLSITAPFDYTMGSSPSGGTTGVDVGGAATIQFIGNPSGIYTLVPDSTHDELIERIPTVTTQNVKIPNPKIRFGYVGD